MYSFAGLIRRTPPPTFSDTAITDRHSDTTIFPAQSSLGADILVYWIGKIVRTCAPGGSRSLDLLHRGFYSHRVSGCQMKILGVTQKKSPHKMFLHKCVLQYVRTLKLNDATLASLGKLKYSKWRPRWPPKDKILSIFLSMWVRHIIFCGYT